LPRLRTTGWCTEGFDTADLQDAKALLEALASRNVSGHPSFSPILDMYVHKLLNMNHFYEVLADNVRACSLPSRIGEVSYKL